MKTPQVQWNGQRKCFAARFRVDGVRKYHDLGDTLEEAKERLAVLLAARGRAVMVPKVQTPGKVATVRQALERYREHQRSARRVCAQHLAHLEYHLKQLADFNDGKGWRMGDVPVGMATPEMLVMYLETARARGWSGGTLRHAAVHAKAAMRFCVRAGLIERNPWEVVSTPSGVVMERVALSREQVTQVLEAARPADRGMLTVLYETGARPSEIAGARWEHLRGAAMVLPEHKTRRKTGQARVVPLNSRALAVIRALPRQRAGLIFPAPEGGMLTTTAWQRMMRRACRGVPGLDWVTPYTFRHSRATHLVEGGVDPATVARVLGNSVQMVLSRYVHPAPEHVKAAIET